MKVKRFKFNKFSCLIILIVVVLVLSITIPSFARYKNRSSINNSIPWDGTVALKYKSGTGSKNDPFIISDGTELAFLSESLLDNDYKDVYFKLSKDIIINNGILSYTVEDGVKYTINQTTYYVNEIGDYFVNKDYIGEKSGSLLKINFLNNFKGTIDGGYYQIFGLFISSNEDNVGLFNNLNGTINNLYVENSIIKGGSTTGLISSSFNSNINNVMFTGNVIGGNESVKTSEFNLNDISYTLENNTLNENISLLDKLNILGSITNMKLSGNLNSDASVNINNSIINNGDFEIDLGDTLLSNFNLSISGNIGSVVNLTNLKVTINYNGGVSGLIGYANNTIINNVVNKSNIYSNNIGGGITGIISGTSSISNSYNNGIITTNNISGGLIGNMVYGNEISINKSYNTGIINSNLNGGLVGVVNNNNTVSFDKCFDTSSSDYVVDTVKLSNVSITSSYLVGGSSISDGYTNGSFNTISIDNLHNNTYMQNSMGYSKFVSFDDQIKYTNNIWMYESGCLPKSFIDDNEASPIKLSTGKYSWDNMSYEVSKNYFKNSVSLKIDQTNINNPQTSISYYVSDRVLNETDFSNIEWKDYKTLINLDKEGNYIVYVKSTDNSGNTTIINSDIFVIDLNGFDISINLDNKKWNTYNSNPSYYNITELKSVSVVNNETLVGIKSIEYYLSDNGKTLDELKSVTWTKYENSIQLDDTKNNILYLKITDEFDNINYINSDIIIFSGYNVSNYYVGNKEYTDINVLSITNKSSINLDFKYSSTLNYSNSVKHNLIIGSSIVPDIEFTLINNKNGKVYSYITNNTDDYKYESLGYSFLPLTLFNEVGTSEKGKYLENNEGTIDEDYTIIIDYNKSNISNINNCYIKLELVNGDNTISTLNDNIKYYNILSNSDSSLYVNSNNINNIILNSDSTTNIDINSGINYVLNNNNKIYDTLNDDKYINLSIAMYDSDNNIVSKDLYKNVMFKIDDKYYYSNKDNVVNINLRSLENSTKTLSIITSKDNIKLDSGNYKFVVKSNTSYDGVYNSLSSNESIQVPVIVDNTKYMSDYTFDVTLNDSNIFINKDDIYKLPIFVNSTGIFTDKKVKVSLYKKDTIESFDLNYSIVDLRDLTNDSLISLGNKKYLVNFNELSIDTKKLEYTGYKFVFELYDGDILVDTINKYMIVK